MNSTNRRRFDKGTVFDKQVDDIWTADLVDMSPFSRLNKDYKYLLTVIDIFSKYGWIVPLKTKTGKEVAQALILPLVMGNKIVQANEDKKTLTVDGTVYDFTRGLEVLIMLKHPRPTQYDDDTDLRVYRSLVIQTKVRSHPNPAGAARPRGTWKYKQMLRKMVLLGERIEEEETEDSEGIYTASLGNISELLPPSDTDSIRGFDESIDSGILSPPSPANTRSHGKARKAKDREEKPFIKVTKVKE